MNLWLTHRSYYTQLRQLWNKAWKKKFRPERNQTYALCETIRTFVVGCADGMTCFTTTIKMMSVTVFAKELTMAQIKMRWWGREWPGFNGRLKSGQTLWRHEGNQLPLQGWRSMLSWWNHYYIRDNSRTCSGIPRTNYNHLSGHLLWLEVSILLDGVGLT